MSCHPERSEGSTGVRATGAVPGNFNRKYWTLVTCYGSRAKVAKENMSCHPERSERSTGVRATGAVPGNFTRKYCPLVTRYD
jgi:hypothetical protein